MKYCHESPSLVGTFILPLGYPETESPKFSLSIADRQYASKKKFLENSVNKTIQELVHEVVLFSAIQTLKELIETDDIVDDAVEDSHESDSNFCLENPCYNAEYPSSSDGKAKQYNNHSSSSSRNTGMPSTLNVIHGPTTEESKSTFQSHVAKVYSMNDVRLFKEIVLSDKKVRHGDIRVLRIESVFYECCVTIMLQTMVHACS